MRSIQRLFLLLIAASLGYSAALRAEDTDIYVDGTTSTGTPNVVFVIDTGANFSSSASSSCTYTVGGGSPSLGTTAGGIEQCALVNAIEGLADGVVNIGILVNNNNNFATDTRLSTDTAYHEVCGGTYGGCVIRKLTLMNAANKANLVTFIKSWKTSGTDSATQFNVKSGGDRTAGMMQEAWAYYNGKIGMSTKNYGSSILSSGCQKNFLIFIGNAFNVSGTPGDTGTESPYNGTYGLTATQTGATSAQLSKISETVKFSPATCGVTSIAASTNASNWSENWADEWARLMYQQDGGASGNTNTQNIISYSIGVVDDTSCKADYPALLSTIAKYGGGKYFKTSSSTDIKNALDAILNEVQAVNSVFSSASLPVSVNAEGSYLNQIYLGMFRPDSSGAPRWMGNLKQYQLIKNSSGNTVLGDANGNAAISAAGTGFITPTAVSFWTFKNTAAVPDNAATGGFWVNDKKGVPESGFDSPDGEVVEKGGVAQQIRKESLTGTFIGATGASGNARRMYTYCPAGTSCVASLTDASNAFTTANSGIASTAFGSSTTVGVTSIVRTGTTALVTTSGNHGLSSGTTVTISNAGQEDYNVTQSVIVNSSTTFTITGIADHPTSPSAGTYTISPAIASSFSITSLSRATSNTGGNTSEVVTVITSSAHAFTTTSTVTLSGITPSAYNVSVTPSAVSTSSFTFNMTLSPNATSVNSYTAVLSNTQYPAITNTTLSNPSQGNISGTTPTAHNYHLGQTITVSSASDGAASKYPGTYTIVTLPSTTKFTATNGGAQPKLQSGVTATVSANTSTTQPIAVGKITRVATTDSAVATVIGLPTDWFGRSVGSTKVVSIAKALGTNTNESAFVFSNKTVTCLTTGCTSFSFPIAVTPASSGITLTGATARVGNSNAMNVLAGQITRSGTTATVTGATANNFVNGQAVNVAASGTALDSEAAYVGSYSIACVAPCITFTFGPVTQSPASPATGTNIQAYSATTPPNKDTAIKWLRGEDNYGDEKGPGGVSGVTVRPSVHGDVLHSRPLVINYGDSRGIVVFYGANDGLYRAINGNQSTAIGSVPAGGELWSLILPEHYTYVNRLRLNSPEIKFPSTTLSSAQKKDYFVDGPTGSYQKLNADGTINKAYVYLTMRRGGRYVYALDVTTPTAPTLLWKIANTVTGFDELGQTWSRPKTTLVQGGGLGNTPVLVFGGGYGPAQDNEPPTTGEMGRSIFVVNAATGALIWSASPTCTTSATCRNVGSMTYAVPSDITTVDRDGNGYADKLYFGDTGGNIWRADISATDTANWTVTRLAALGCDTGACSDGTTPRKFFFPPSVLTVKGSGASGSYEAVSLASGDREHPLRSTASGSSYYVNDRFFMIKDTGTTLGTPATNNVLKATLFNATSVAYDGSGDGFYINFATAEKGVNAPLAVNGQIFFATNRPVDPSSTCAANLGEAKAYAVSPFLGTFDTKVLAGGGLPPSAVSGIVTIVTTNADNTTTSTDEKFCIGCSVGCTGSTCNVALENTPPAVSIPKNLRRTYWYKK